MRFSPVKKALISLFAIVLGLLVLFPVGYFVLADSHSAIVDHLNHSSPANGVVSYIINLDRSKQRYAYVEPNVRQLGYPVERISGIDGKLLSDDEVYKVVDFSAYKNLLGHAPQRGTIGCSLSHIKAWQTFVNSNYEYAIIFEDDVSFNPQELTAAIADLQTATKYWDINNFETSHSGMPLTLRKFADNNRLVVYLTEVSHAGAYIITRSAAEKLLSKALPIKMPIDHYFTRGWELDFKFTGIEPRLVMQQYGDSEIAKTSAQYSPEIAQQGSGIHKALYKLQSYTIRFLYNLKNYII